MGFDIFGGNFLIFFILVTGETLPNIRFSSNVFFVLTRVKSRAKASIVQKALLEKKMFGSVPPGMYIFDM